MVSILSHKTRGTHWLIIHSETQMSCICCKLLLALFSNLVSIYIYIVLIQHSIGFFTFLLGFSLLHLKNKEQICWLVTKGDSNVYVKDDALDQDKFFPYPLTINKKCIQKIFLLWWIYEGALNREIPFCFV